MLRVLKRIPFSMSSLLKQPSSQFSERLDELEARKKERLINGLKSTEAPQYWITSARPGNFGDPLQVPTKPDNWFDLNRIWNEEDEDYRTRRTKMYVFDMFYYGMWLTILGSSIRWLYERWLQKTQWRIKDTYAEYDITNLEPGKTILADYRGEPIFIRMLTRSDVEKTLKLDEKIQHDTKSYVATTGKDDKQILVVYAKTNKGTIPEPLKGPYEGWYCPITGQVFDKLGRITKEGKKGKNLQYVNNTLHGNILCLEQRMGYYSNYSLYYI